MRVMPSKSAKPSQGVIVSGALPSNKDLPVSLPTQFKIDTKNASQLGKKPLSESIFDKITIFVY